MCESNAYLLKDGEEELLLKDVIRVRPLDGGKLRLESLLGEEKEVQGSIREINFSDHKILIG